MGILISGLGKKFKDEWIFRALDLRIEAGASASLIGPSGSGKSVLLKIIAGLIAPSEGSTQVKREQLGMLFQKNALFDSFTVEENLLFPLRERLGVIGPEAKRRTREMLEEVGLAGNERLFPDEISGGMQKRLGIARALIVEPAVVLYDEPTAGLDPITSQKIALLIRKLQARNGGTLLTVTNDMQRAYQLGDRVWVLALGRLHGGLDPEATQSSGNELVRQFIYGRANGPLTEGASA